MDHVNIAAMSNVSTKRPDIDVVFGWARIDRLNQTTTEAK